MNEEWTKWKEAMDKTVFKEMRFSSKLQAKVLSQMERPTRPSEQAIESILSIIFHHTLAGYDILLKLEQKGELIFQAQEGELYHLLHKLEQKQFIEGEWQEEQKYYRLTKKGMKYLLELQKEKGQNHHFRKQEGWT